VKRDTEGTVEAEGSQAEVEAKAPTQPPSSPESTAVTQVPVPDQAPAATPTPTRPVPKLEDLEAPEDAYRRVLDEQTKAGSSPQVAKARAKVGRVKAEREVTRAKAAVVSEDATPTPEPSGAPEATEPRPEQGPVAPTEEERGAGSAGPQEQKGTKGPND
jgi:hypothetical protein